MSFAVPPDNACSELPSVSNGGVVYSDLNLSPGTTAKYICDAGYTLQTLQGRSEFSCNEDGIWDGNVAEVPVECHGELVIKRTVKLPIKDIPRRGHSRSNFSGKVQCCVLFVVVFLFCLLFVLFGDFKGEDEGLNRYIIYLHCGNKS